MSNNIINDLMVNGTVKTIPSYEVSEMMEREHWKVLRMLEGSNDVVGIIPTLTDNRTVVSDFFIESSYKDASGKENKCYECTKMGCDMLANKLTGTKGILFTAKYVKQFNEIVVNKEEQLVLDIYASVSNGDSVRAIVLSNELAKLKEEEGIKKGVEIGYEKAFEDIKNERITPLCTITHIVNTIKVKSLNVGALNIFLANRGLGRLERVVRNNKLITNANFEKAIIENGWACYTNENKTTFRFYEAFADIVNANMDYYKDELEKAKREYAEIIRVTKNKNNVPF